MENFMQVILAQPRGFCAGVVRAIEIVERALQKYGAPVYVRHEIVHNRHVVESLKAKGARFIDELSEAPPGAVTIFSAHGVAKAVEDEADERGLRVLNATCPLVTKVHLQGKNYVKNGRQVILIGHAGHPEILGTMGQIDGPVSLVSTEADVERLDIPVDTPVSYVTQTTLSRFTDIVGPDTKDICYATQNRQSAVHELCKRADVLLVVGATNSSNSNRLREIGAESGVPSYLLADGSELDAQWVHGANTIGITAGASAPESMVDDVIDALRRLGPVDVSVMDAKESKLAIPFLQSAYVGAYLIKQRLKRNKRYPLVLMLEPLFRCNLACSGCGKIDYPDPILNQRVSLAESLEAVDECGAPVVSIAGGEPLLHKDMPEIVKGIIARRKFVYLCTNALLLEKKIDDYQPSPFFVWSIHLDGDREAHDKSVCQQGVYERCVSAIKLAKSRGFRVNINCTLFNDAQPERVATFFDDVKRLGVDGITVSPGYAYERAPDQQHFLNREKTKNLFRDILRRGHGGKAWSFSQSGLFLDFLAGNRTYHCTPWGNPTRTVFGWQRPCYLLGEGYAKTYRELMETTDWDRYGTGNYEKCADCMVHSGYEATAVNDTIAHPLRALGVSLRGVKTEGPFAPDVLLDRQRPAEYVFSRHVEIKLSELRQSKA
ncbi:hypothetical protein DFQ30_005593 [Apophysomyces sp. BC1015]|nr:hypothetical protein DFQ30_005593 [Apophysomyces sp. BC1015]